MLGQPVSMLIPQVVGFRLVGELPEGATATDLVLTVTQRLRERGVVGKFVEFFGEGLAGLPLADRATIGNMAPEYGATCGIFPVDAETLRYLEFSGRPPERVELVEAYCREQGLFHDEQSRGRRLLRHAGARPRRGGAVARRAQAPAGPRGARRRSPGLPRRAGRDARRRRRRRASRATTRRPRRASRRATARRPTAAAPPPKPGHEHAQTAVAERSEGLGHGSVVIAAITSCTNTSNPSVMLGAGLLAKKAVEAGLTRKPWVKTSLAPGSKVVTEYLERAGLIEPLSQLGFDLVGYGCTTCIGNSGPLPGGDLGRDRGARPDRGVGAVGQPQLRGAHPPRGEDELPRLPAAVRGLRAGRPDGPRPGGGAAPGRRAPARPLAEPQGGQRGDGAARSSRTCSARATARCSRATRTGTSSRCPRATATPGIPSPPTCGARPTSRGCRPRRPRASSAITRRARARRARRQRHDRPHLPGRRDQEGLAGGQLPDRARRRAPRVQLLRLAARQPRGDDARHVRQHPPAQPARAGHRGRLHHQGRRGHDDLRGRHGVRRRGRPRCASSPARSMAPARRATGRPRDRACWACAS